MDNDILNRLEKQMEGNGLALAAVAEVLQKMDFRLMKADDAEEDERAEDEEVEEMQYAEMEKAELIKSIAFEVTDMLKAGTYDGDRGVPVDGEHVRSATKTGNASSADDSEKGVSIDSKTENVQGIIQAMQKQIQLLKEGIGEGSEEDPVTDDDDDDDDEKKWPFEEGSMQQAIQNAVQTETEARLRKMGFREETGLQGPRLINYDDPSMSMGVDGTTPIKKAPTTNVDMVDELTKLSYKQLREMQIQVESGDTDGLPQEFINN